MNLIFLADLIIFGVTIKLMIILYIFIGAAGLSLLVFLLNLLFRKNKYKKTNSNDANWNKIKELEQSQINIDDEIESIVKSRKNRGTH